MSKTIKDAPKAKAHPATKASLTKDIEQLNKDMKHSQSLGDMQSVTRLQGEIAEKQTELDAIDA